MSLSVKKIKDSRSEVPISIGTYHDLDCRYLFTKVTRKSAGRTLFYCKEKSNIEIYKETGIMVVTCKNCPLKK